MVSALQAVSVALVSVLSGAGWFLWTPKGGDAPATGHFAFEEAAAPLAFSPDASATAGLRVDRGNVNININIKQTYPAWRENAMKSTLVPSPVRRSVIEVALSSARHAELQQGRWLVLV